VTKGINSLQKRVTELHSMINSLRWKKTGNEIHIVPALLVILLLASCAPMQMPDQRATSDETSNAQSLSDQGQHQVSADAYMQLAEEAGYKDRQYYLILVARERYLAGNPEIAATILSRLGDSIEPSNLLTWSQVAAEVAIATGNPQQALEYLEQAPPTSDTEAAVNLQRIRSNALFRLGQPVAATRVLIDREAWLSDRAAIAVNQRLIWDGLQTWGSDLWSRPFPEEYDQLLAGWLDLGFIAWSRRTNAMAMRADLINWQSANPSHPANRVLVQEILGGLTVVEQYPQQVAVLLPLSSRQRAAANAVRDGFLAAHFASADLPNRPTIRIYDIHGFDVGDVYELAVAEGADFVVGPLLKSSVQTLAETGVSTPTLALNFLPTDSPAPRGFYQFALSPEEEARQVAERATSLGQYRALALAPDSDWGRRLLGSFASEMQRRGGQLLHYGLFDPASPDFSASIEDLLLIDESRARKDRLTANVGIKLEYEPRRRADIDLIFLAANADAGKSIRPQLRFHYAGSIPTYSTSAIYQEGSRNNSDINGIMFPDIPWVIAPDGESTELRNTLTDYWPNQAERRSRLYAMGFDAYRLVPLINAGMGPNRLQAMTGILSLDENGRILRRLPWARIQRGQPKLMDPKPLPSSMP
jgi:outer membrane PBP1 activator LpoA protein